MKFSHFVRKLAVILFFIALIGAFPLAKRLSTTVTIIEYKYNPNRIDRETDIAKFIGVLLVTWISSSVVCVLLYGIGEVLEYLYYINKRLITLDRIRENEPTTQEETSSELSIPINLNNDSEADTGYWICTSCGKYNLEYIGTCVCGRGRNESE